MFFDRFLGMEHPVAPSSLIWKNVSYTKCNRLVRSIIVWIFSCALVFTALILMVYFKDWNDELKANADPNMICPYDEAHKGEFYEVTPMMAYDDFLLVPKNRKGNLHCFCKVFNSNSTIDDAYELLLEIDPELDPNPCIAWKSSF